MESATSRLVGTHSLTHSLMHCPVCPALHAAPPLPSTPATIRQPPEESKTPHTIHYSVGNVGIGASAPAALLHLQDFSAAGSPTEILIESTDEGAVGLQLKSLMSSNNWQLKLHGDAVTIGKVGVPDYLTINPAGLVSAPNGYAVGPSVGLSTNIQVLAPGPKTNILAFTKGLLTSVQ